jgi:hypothetical protein
MGFTWSPGLRGSVYKTAPSLPLSAGACGPGNRFPFPSRRPLPRFRDDPRFASWIRVGDDATVGGGPPRSHGSSAFAIALRDLPPTSLSRRCGGLRGPSLRSRPRTFARDRCALLTLVPSFPAHPGPCRPALHRASSLGVVQRSPLHRPRIVESTPGRDLRRFLRGRESHLSSRVPSSWFRTTSTVYSARRTAGLLHPAAGPGVRRVSRNPLPQSRRPTRRPSEKTGVRKASSPRRDLYPSKSSPRPQPYRVTTACASVPLGRTRW